MTDPATRLLEENPNAIAHRLMQKAHTQDGLWEIAVGLWMLIPSGLFAATRIFPRGSMSFKAVLAFVTLLPLFGFGTPWAVKWVRRRFLIERAGYVKAKPLPRQSVFIILVVILAIFVFPHFSWYGSWMPSHGRWMLVYDGLIFGAMIAFIGRSLRFVVYGSLVAVACVLFALSGVSLGACFAMLWVGLGLLSLLSGCVVFLRFIRQPAETGE